MGEDQSQPQLEWIKTADGARIAIKRRASGGTPVILLHGLAVHADMWDVPPIAGVGFEFRGLARVLHEAGFDVWFPNFRGHGPPDSYSEPAPRQRDWAVDHFILHDVPAIIEHVTNATGQKPFVVGVSMGAMSLGGYLQGARMEPGGGPVKEARIVADEELSRLRQAGLRGAVFLTYPAALRWPRALHGEDGKLAWRDLLSDWNSAEADNNYPFELMARWGWLEALLAGAGEIPLNWLRSSGPGSKLPRLPAAVTSVLERSEKAFLQGLLKLADGFSGAGNHRAEIMLYGRKHIIERMKAGVLRQMAKSIRQRGFVSLIGTDDYVYSDHYDMVDMPLLVVAGGRDRIANPAATREVFFERVRSGDKTFRILEQLGHGEFTAAPMGAELAYPVVREWMAERDK